MPIYEYLCVKCESHFEKLQKSTDDPLSVCEKCNGRLEKQWSLSGFQFKGEGWYVTDYAKDKKNPSAEKSEKNSEKKSTAKPETASKKTKETKKETVSKTD